MSSPWTDELTDRLKKLWDAGYSCSQIGAELGVTRNSVIGRVHRLGLSKRLWGNGYSRIVDPTPLVDKPPRPARERKPRFERLPKPPKILNVVSPLTGALISKIITRRPREPERTKTEMRAMLTLAVQNTAAMEAP